MSMHRSPGEGNLYQKNGRWYAALMDGYTEEGKRNLVRFHSTSKKDVLNQLAQYRANRQKYFSPDSKTLFQVLADRWFLSITPDLQPSTLPGYKSTLVHLKEGFGNFRIGEIKTIHVNDYLSHMQSEGYSFTMVDKLKVMLNQIMEAAIDNEMIFINPVKRSKKLAKARFASTQKRFNHKDSWTDQEFFTPLDKLPETRLGKSVWLMLVTGMRTQELLALDRDHIAEDGSWVYIEFAIKAGPEGPYLSSPKTESSKRYVAVPQEYQNYVAGIRKLCDPMLWSNDDGTTYSPAVFRYHFHKLLEEFPNVRSLTPHCCRHTYVSRLMANDVPIDLITANTGHASPVNAKPYMHFTLATKGKASNRLFLHTPQV